MAQVESPYRCVGIFGRLFGHKFMKARGDYVHMVDYCWRCGMPMGGWRVVGGEPNDHKG